MQIISLNIFYLLGTQLKHTINIDTLNYKKIRNINNFFSENKHQTSFKFPVK